MFESLQDENPWPRLAVASAAILLLPIFAFGICDLFRLPVPVAYLGPCLMGFFLSLFHPGGTRHARLFYWVWILPFGLVAAGHIWHDGIPQQVLFLEEFSSQPPEDEGLTALLIVSPMFGAMAYALGRVAVWDRVRRQTPTAED